MPTEELATSAFENGGSQSQTAESRHGTSRVERPIKCDSAQRLKLSFPRGYSPLKARGTGPPARLSWRPLALSEGAIIASVTPRRPPLPSRCALVSIGLLLLAPSCGPLRASPATEELKPRPTAIPSPNATSTGADSEADGATSMPEPSPTPAPKQTLAPRPGPPAEAEAGDTWESPVDGMTLLYLPTDDFPMGTLDEFEGGQPDEEPFHRVTLDAYWIDQTEVTRDMYARCAQAGNCPQPPPAAGADGDHPVTGIPWDGARLYCTWAGRRLPTEAEWERAARGEDGRRYPWGWIGAAESGRGVNLNYCDSNCPFQYADETVDDGYARTAPVGSFPQGASPAGALDMAGNVWEWTADWYAADYYEESPEENPLGPARGRWRAIRGGSWVESAYEGIVLSSRASNRAYLDPSRGQPDLGFRCALDAAKGEEGP